MAILNLNAPQKEASIIVDGATMIIAGAGCGKTRVITTRIEYLLNVAHAIPTSILALTFTNKAAKEMLHRLEENNENNWDFGKPFLGTFHSFCFFLLKKYGLDFGLSSFGILDSTDQQSIVKKILDKYGLIKEFTPKKILSYISMQKNNLTNTPNQDTGFAQKQILEEICLAYEKEKKLSNNLDFDDLILTVYKKFITDKTFLKKIQNTINHVLIDEYQDTSKMQHDLIKLLTLDENKNLIVESVFAVGDQDQGIYSWRGATPENVNFFLEDFKPVKLIKIEQNYRSNQQILSAANSVINNNKARTEKKLWSEKTGINCIFIAKCKNEYQEAQVVANSIQMYLAETPKSTCAILYRNHYQSRTIEESMIQSRIRYKIIGGIKFYERREVKDLIAYLKLSCNPSDWLSLNRIINTPSRGLGEKFIEKMESVILESQIEEQFELNFKSVLHKMLELASQERTKTGINVILKLYEKNLETQSPTKSLQDIIEQINYLDFIKKEYEPQEAQEKIENIEELQRSIQNFELNFNGAATTKDFLEEIALIQEAETNLEKTENSVVQMMSLHGAKGLEFDKVVIIGLEEGILPSIKKDQGIEEERRLFYVGITRARDKLLLTYSEARNEYGKINTQSPSRFLNEIPKKLTLESTSSNTIDIKNSLKNWVLNKVTTQQFTQIKQPVSHPFNKFIPKPRTIIPEKIIKTIEPATKIKSEFEINQIVHHETFGHGLVKKVFLEGGAIILEIIFKTATKEINSSFIKKA